MKVFKDDAFTKICGDVAYGFYGRSGGVSSGIYASLNCGTGSNDDQNNIAQNRSIVAKNLGAKDGVVSTVWQCHSSLCLSIKSPVLKGDERPKADALVTDVAGLPIGVLTADCGPVLFVGKKENGAPIVAAAHAGWGGALGGILEETITVMVQGGAVLSSITACVGPCIGQASYEVKDNFAVPFLKRNDEAERFFMAGQRAGHLMFDLAGYIAFRLSGTGVSKVLLMGVDTYKNEQNCFSYRRATHRGEGDYGRQLSAIVIKL